MPWNQITNIKGPEGVAGSPGDDGVNAFSFTDNSFTVPAVGMTVTVELLDASWIVVGQMLYVEGAGEGEEAGALQVTAKNGNQITLLNPVAPDAIDLRGLARIGFVYVPAHNL